MPQESREGYYFGAMDAEALSIVMQAGQKKRASERVIIEYEPKNLKAHLKGADRVNARYCAVIGENELKNNSIWIKDLVQKDEQTIMLDAL
jgi:histidyl-tRNA synthetase